MRELERFKGRSGTPYEAINFWWDCAINEMKNGLGTKNDRILLPFDRHVVMCKEDVRIKLHAQHSTDLSRSTLG